MAPDPGSASLPGNSAAGDADSEPPSPKRARSLDPLSTSKGFKKLAYSSKLDYNAHFRVKGTDSSLVDLNTAPAHAVDFVHLAEKLPLIPRVEKNSVGHSELSQIELPTTHSSRSLCSRQHEETSTSCVPNNHLDPSTPLEQRPSPSTPHENHSHCDLPLSKTPPLTKHTLSHSPNEIQKQKTKTLLELPLDVLCLVADNLDIIARTCLKYAHPAFGCFSKEDFGTLSRCARSRIFRLLQRDHVSIPKELHNSISKKWSCEGECVDYHKGTRDLMYCGICRCHGHLSRCPGCRIRTCAREDNAFWRKYTRFVDDETLLPATIVHHSP